MNRFTLLCILLILGGMVAFSPYVGAVEDGFWESMAEMPNGKAWIDAGVVNGKIYIIKSGANYIYNPVNDEWKTKTPIPQGSGIAVAGYKDELYVINKDGTVQVYDPATDSWENRTVMPTPRIQVDINVVNGKLYIISGRTGGPYSTVDVNEVYDPTTDTWSTAQPIPYPVVDYASAVVDGKIYVMGGQDEFYPGPINLNFTQIYDPETDTWSQGAQMGSGLLGAVAGATTGTNAPKRIYVMDGLAGFQESSSANNVYNPEEDMWTSEPPIPTPRREHAVAVVNDRIYVIGGISQTSFSPPIATVERYTPLGYLPDTTPPTVSLISPGNQTFPSNQVPLNFTVDELISWTGYTLDGHDNITIHGNTTLTALSEGTHCLTMYAKDVEGNTGASEPVYFTVDTSPPAINIVSPENETYPITEVWFNFTTTKPVSWMGYSLDGEANTTITGNITLTELSCGNHSLTVYANDTVGNLGASTTVHFKVTQRTSFLISWVVTALVITVITLVMWWGYRQTVKEEMV